MALKTYQIIIVDDTGSTTHRVQEALDMLDAMHKATGNVKTKNIQSISAITATTL